MNYKLKYDCIILNAISKNRSKKDEQYYESHHILPRCLGGNDEKSNLVLLTAREHFIVHRLLTKFTNNHKINYAFYAICNQKNSHKRDYKVTSKTYEYAKKNLFTDEYRLKCSIRVIEYNKTLTPLERKQKFGHSGDKNPMYGKTHSPEVKKLLSEINLGRKASISSRKKMSISRKGKTHSIQHRKNVSLSKTGKKHPKFKGYFKIPDNDTYFESMSSVAKFLNIDPSTVARRIKVINFQNGFLSQNN